MKGGERVLEIRTGSGYAAAVLAEIVAEVHTIERISELAEKAASTLDALGYRSVHVIHADGTLGWAAGAPYDAIIVAAGSPAVPELLKGQLKVGGRLVIPVGTDPRAQELVRVTRISNEEFKSEDIADVGFSNRPFRVKHFQTIHRCSVDVAHGLALLFGIGAKALPLWDSRMRWSNLCSGLAVRRNGRSKRTCELTSSIVPRGTSSTARWSSSFLLLDLIL